MKSRVTECLRWIGVLPAAVGAYVGIQILIGLTSYLRVGMDVDFWSQLISSAAGPYCLVWAGAKTAPRFRFIAALALAILHATAYSSVVTLAMSLANSNSTSLGWAVVCGAAGIIGSMAACIQFRHEEQKDKERQDGDSDSDLDQIESELSRIQHDAYLADSEEEKQILLRRLSALKTRLDAPQLRRELKVENVRLELAKDLQERNPNRYRKDLLPTFDEWLSVERHCGAKGTDRDSFLISYCDDLEKRYNHELAQLAVEEVRGCGAESEGAAEERFDLDSVIARAEANKGKPLTPQERAEFERMVLELEDAEEKIAEIQQRGSPVCPSEDT